MVVQGAGLGVLLCAMAASAAEQTPSHEQVFRVTPTQGSIQIDGKLDEAAWAAAPLFDAFVQRYPTPGASPSERTELRILYDSDRVYVGIIAHDSQPALIDRRLGRRDTFFTTDAVRLIIDPTLDHRTGYLFFLSAGGIQGDGLFFDDRNFTSDWDGVWDGATGSVENGWVAEFSIPLSLLRFPESDVQTWGFSVRREIARLNEEIESVDNPRTYNANVSRIGHLTGMEGLKPRRAIELVPYLATRGILRPRYSDTARPGGRLLDPTLDVGLDMKAALTSDLALNATINPDFGQVEADQLILNVTTFETFFPEKRPFFNQGLELFQPVGAEAGAVPHTLFYSRRIGLQTPILGAAKVTGTVAKGVQVGVLNALVAGPFQEQDEENPDRRWQLYGSRPLHLGPNDSLPGEPQPTTNFLAAVARGGVGQNSRLGVSFTSATPLEGTCSAEQAVLAPSPVECLGRGGLAGAADFDLKTADGSYAVMGQVDASRIVGGPPERTLPDGTVLRRGGGGYGAYLRAGRFGGDGFRWNLDYDFSSPTLDLNAGGFQRTQNEQVARATLRYERPNGVGSLKSLSAWVRGTGRWSTDGRGVNRGNSWVATVSGTLPSFDLVGLQVFGDFGGYDQRELDGTGIPLQKDWQTYVLFLAETNGNRALVLSGSATMGYHGRGPGPGGLGWGSLFSLSLRPHPALETRAEVSLDRTSHGPRFVENLGDNRFLLGSLQSNYISFTLRQQWVLRPRLTLQGYAQLFTAYGTYGPFWEGASDASRTPIRYSSLTRVEGQANNFYDAALNLNLVLGWEYRLGSTLFFVYTRSQQALPTPEGEPVPATLLPRRLLSGPATDAVLLKWSYYWST